MEAGLGWAAFLCTCAGRQVGGVDGYTYAAQRLLMIVRQKGFDLGLVGDDLCRA